MKHKAFQAVIFVCAAFVGAKLFVIPHPAFAASINIVAIGDSNIAGRGVGSSETYPAKLERALHAKGYDVHVANEGINGDTVPGVASRVDGAVPSGTKLAIVWVGINDLRKGASAAQVEQGRQAIAAKLRARGIRVLLLGPRHGLAGQPKYLTGDQQQHLNPAGYDVIVARTIGRVQALIGGKH
jgi:acyl-CoA thioesterase-1